MFHKNLAFADGILSEKTTKTTQINTNFLPIKKSIFNFI